MSQFSEAVHRYKQAQRTHDWREQQYTREQSEQLRDYLIEALAESQGSLSVVRGMKPDGTEVIFHKVDGYEGEEGAFNMSAPCPPFGNC